MKRLLYLPALMISCLSAPEPTDTYTVAVCSNGPPDGRYETTCLIGSIPTGYQASMNGAAFTSADVSVVRDWCCAQGATQEAATDTTECLGANPCTGLQYLGESYCLASGDRCLCGSQAEVDETWRYLSTRRVDSCPVPTVRDGYAFCCDTFSGLCACYVRPAEECAELAACFPDSYLEMCP